VTLVLDASVALAWLYERDDKAEADIAMRALSTVAEAGTVVPALWHTEVVNGLLVGERRGVVTEARVYDYLARLERLPIETDEVSPATRRESVLALARQYGLSAYDATYLDLALRANAALATFDRKLARSASAAGVVRIA
jgi:predicted nucleic acid-binding protein